MANNLNSFYQKLVSARPATDINPEGRSGLDKDHFALIQEYLFYAQIIFEKPTNLTQKFMGSTDNTRIALFGIDFFNNKNIYELYAENIIIPLTIRSISLPNASTNAIEGEIDNDFGKVMFPSKGSIIPDSNNITIQFLNSEQNILEHMMYDWIIETKSNRWMYDTHPFSRATIRINYLDQKGESIIFSYDFYGAFPIAYDTIDSNYNPEANLERAVTFSFNWFHVDTEKRPFVDKTQTQAQTPLERLNDIIPSNELIFDDIRPSVSQNLEQLARRFNNSRTIDQSITGITDTSAFNNIV
jgi:hypothetical protein